MGSLYIDDAYICVCIIYIHVEYFLITHETECSHWDVNVHSISKYFWLWPFNTFIKCILSIVKFLLKLRGKWIACKGHWYINMQQIHWSTVTHRRPNDEMNNIFYKWMINIHSSCTLFMERTRSARTATSLKHTVSCNDKISH